MIIALLCVIINDLEEIFESSSNFSSSSFFFVVEKLSFFVPCLENIFHNIFFTLVWAMWKSCELVIRRKTKKKKIVKHIDNVFMVDWYDDDIKFQRELESIERN